jgi:hypothetical protein
MHDMVASNHHEEQRPVNAGAAPQALASTDVVSHPPQPAGFARSLAGLRICLVGLIGLLIWVSIISVPVVEAVGVDQSWERALAHFFHKEAQAGVDYVFTFGPLGVFYTTAFDATLFWPKYAWEILVKLVFTVLLLHLMSRLPDIASKILFCFVIGMFLGVDSRHINETLYQLFVSDALYAFVLTYIGVLLVESEGCRAIQIAMALLLAMVSLVKFTFLLLAISLVLVAAAQWTWSGRKGQATALVFTFMISFLAGWLLLGQSLFNLPAYFYSSWQIASGYTDGMGLAGSNFDLGLAIAILVGLLLQLWLAMGSARSRSWRPATSAIIATSICLLWKHGFTRQDEHAFVFFTSAIFLPFLLIPPGTIGKWRRAASYGVMLVTVVMGVIGVHSVTKSNWSPDLALEEWTTRLKVRAGFVFHPRHEIARLNSLAGLSKKGWELPQMKAVIGNGTVDLLSSLCGIVFANDLNWGPRPVFQSYSAYTPSLAAMNARFFASERAPEFVIIHFTPIDKHLSAMEDWPALREILRTYVPAMVEKHLLLLRHIPATTSTQNAPQSDAIVLDRTVHFEERIDLSRLQGQAAVLSVGFQPTMLGRLRSLFFRPASLWMTLETAEGKEVRYRIVPALAEAGFLINPLVETYNDILKIFGTARAKQVRSLRFSCEGAGYGDYMRLSLQAVTGLVSSGVTAEPASR